MNVAHSIERGRRQYPERAAVLFEGATISYGELDALANRAANGLRSLGVRRGDRVAFCLPNIPEFIVGLSRRSEDRSDRGIGESEPDGG